jgi:integrase
LHEAGLGVDRWGFEPQAFAMPSFTGMNRSNGSFKVTKQLYKEYIEYRRSRLKAKKSLYWIKKSIEDFLNSSNWEINRDTLLNFQNWYRANYGFEAQAKYHSNIKNFLEWLYKKTGNHFFRDLKEVLEPPKRDSKKLNPIIIREEDVKNIIRAIWKGNYPPFLKLKYIAGILFASYTGQRPESTIGKITVGEFKEALSRNPPVLWIPENKDKERFPHWVPLHPVVVKWVGAYVSLMKKDREIAFGYYALRKLLDDLNIKAIHTGRKIAISHMRKFFEQMCNNVLMVHPGLRDYIMAHNTGSLDVQSYDGKLPSEIYEQYMMAWKDVNLVPEEVNLKALIKEVKL